MSQAWWHMFLMPALPVGKDRPNPEFEARLVVYRVSSGTDRATQGNLVSENKTEENKTKKDSGLKSDCLA